MVQFRTAKERLEKKLEERQQKDKMILARFNEICKVHTVSDAVNLTANEFNLSPMTIYNIRRRNS